MPFIVPLDAELDTLANIIGALLTGSTMHLFDNNVTIGTATLVASLNEASFAGYSSVSLVGWSSPLIDGTNHAYTIPTTPTFTPTAPGGSGNLYGYWIDKGSDFIGAQNFPTPPIVVAQSIVLSIPFTYTVISEF